MLIRQLQPPEYLRDYVRYFWIAEDKLPENRIVRPITDGCPGLVWQRFAEPQLTDQHRKQLPSLFLYGQTVQHRELHSPNGFNAIGVCLYPLALKALFDVDAHELTDSCTDLNALSAKQGFPLAERLEQESSVAEQVQLIASYLFRHVNRTRAEHDNPTAFAVKRLIETGGTVSMSELQQQLNISERGLERRFRRWVGISPKLFSRICRFQRSLTQLKDKNYNKLSDIAFDNGYADQAHFIRIFKEFAGYAPRQHHNQPSQGLENLTLWYP